MLAQRKGLPAGRRLKDGAEAAGCCPPAAGCPWARLAGVDGCLSEPYCLWFQLLARAYWGEVELGLGGGRGRSAVSWARLREASRNNCVRSRAKQKDGRDHSEASATAAAAAAADASPADEEPFSWPGPKTLHLRRTSQGFGFTLRHFIVYPPESAVHNSMKDEENGSRGRQRNRLEPMDTIFVKQVKEGGPAHGAGLCTGDRIVKVNGESIIGKTYSQVIALIQNSDASLELCVMPKDEDILQLAYSQDAYLKGNQAYSGNAQNIPEPPPICYPRIEVKAVGRGQGAEPPGRNDRSYRPDVPLPPSPPAPEARTCQRSAAATPEPPDAGSRAAPGHGSRDDRFAALPDPHASPRPRPLIPSLPGGAQPQNPLPRGAEPLAFSPASRGAAPPPALCPDTRTPLTRAPLAAPSPDTLSTAASPSSNRYSPSPSPSPSAPSPSALTPAPAPAPSSSPHQNIDWRTYTTYKDYIDAKRLHTYGCRTIQERLDSLRAAANSSSAYAQQRPAPPPSQRGTPPAPLRRRSASNDDGGGRAAASAAAATAPLRSVSQERLGAEGAAPSRKWPRSASQDALPSSGPSGPGQGRARSCDFLGQRSAGGGGGGGGDEGAGSEERLLVSRGEEARASRQSPALRAQPQLGRGAGAAGSSSAPFHRGRDWAPPPRSELHLTRPSRLPVKNSVPDFAWPKAPDPLRDQRAGVTADHPGGLRGRADSLRAESRGEAGLAARSSSCSSKLPLQRQSPAVRTNGEAVEGADATVVVLRREKSSGAAHVRPPSYALAVNDRKGVHKSPPLVKAGSLDGATSWRSADCGGGGGGGETRPRMLADSGTGSGSKDLDHSLDSIPFIDEPSSPSLEQDSAPLPPLPPTITTIPPSPPSPSPLIRRQLSHDQDSLRLTIIESDSATKSERSKSCDEGLDTYRDEARGRSLIPGLKTVRKTVDRSSEDLGSRRHSSSDVLCDTTKEGLLHVKQLNTEKGKRGGGGGGGGGIRPWKQMYVVLRGQHLYLYKERREAAAAAGGEEPLAISVKACLIDISYSDTKRKNVLRLTTSACECLFQAEDREDMLAWIRVIQESSSLDQENASFTSHDLISRKIKEYNTLMSPTGSKSDASPRASRQSLSIRHSLLGGKEAKASSPHSPRAQHQQHQQQQQQHQHQHQRRNMHKDDTSPPKDRGPWRKGLPGLMRKPFEKKPSVGVTFGVRLDDCPPAHNNKFVPLIVEVCCKLVEERGLEYTGIYRVPGNNAAISSMQEELNNKGLGDIDIQDDKWRDLNVISSLLKSFFRKLPEPLFTNDKYSDFIEANRIDDPLERLKVLKCLLHELPDHHYETLKFLSAHLKTVADNSEKNKMEPRNLAIVFGPTLVRTTEDNMTHMVTHMPDQYKIVETLIQNYDWFFTEDGNGDPVTVSAEDSAVESQPLPNIDHLLTNIGRTAASQGEVSDSPTSDSAKSKGSWGSGKDRELLVSSIFAAASRKRKKSKEKPQPSSSDDDLDAVFPKKEPHAAKGGAHADRKESGRGAQLTPKAKREHRAPSLLRAQTTSTTTTTTTPGRPSPAASPPPPDDNTSDLSTVSSGASCQRWRPRKWAAGGGAAPGAEVSSITSDYSTTSSITFPTGAEAAALGPQAPGADDDADDERSELVSEGRPMETDSESDFPVFAAAQSTPRPDPAGRATTPKMEARRLFPSHGTPEPAAGRRWSLRQKTDSESSVEGGGGGGGGGEASTRLSRVLEVMKKGRSTSSLSSSSRSESERGEAAWHLRITERLRFRLRSSADDTFAQKSGGEARAKKNNIRRRHTMGGQRDFAQLAVINDWREQSAAAAGTELSALDRLKPRCSSQDFSFRDWISRERRRASSGGAAAEVAPKAVPEDDRAEAGDAKASPPASLGSEHVNGGGPQAKSRAALGGEAHPHKLGGAQVVRSRFYQYL